FPRRVWKLLRVAKEAAHAAPHYPLPNAGQTRRTPVRHRPVRPLVPRPEAGGTGFVRADLSSNVNDPDEFMASACFADRTTYDNNSNDPRQNAWYEELRSHLVADPEWFDGTLERQRIG